MKKFLLPLFATLSLFAAADALAQPGFINAPVVLRAGPADDYPPVVQLGANAGVNIYGCLDGWAWCEVGTGPYRGWAPGEFIYGNYDNYQYSIVDYGPRIGLPFVVFDLNTYWNRYYRHQPFYAQRTSFVHHAPPSRRVVVVNHAEERRSWPSERSHHVDRGQLHPQPQVAPQVAHDAPHERDHEDHDQHGH